ncbi:flagellar export chaperone FlgN [uncultured Jatrophihabitans sp.]|uniref:flagellar export chaperone FlgN n=1 Tax=uncultured Jatrophihabitans sp. TaxID=1610747 RepID=UPI0035C992ED
MERTRTDETSAEVIAPDFRHTPAAVEALTAALWRERELLDSLLYALSAQQRLLETGSTRWLARATAQVSEHIEALREIEVVRSMITDQLVEELRLPASSSLLDLAAAAGEPTVSIHRDLHAATSALVEEIDRTMRVNDDLLLALVGPQPAASSDGRA